MPDNGRVRFEVTLEHGLAEKFAELCRKRRMSKQEMIRSLIRHAGRDKAAIDRVAAQNDQIVKALGLLLDRFGLLDVKTTQRSIGSTGNMGSASWRYTS